MSSVLKKWVVGELSWRRLLVSLLEIYVLVMIGGFLISDHMMFCPQEPGYAAQDPRFFRVPVTDTEKIAMAEAAGPSSNGWTVLYLHGNAEDIGDLRPFFEEYASKGFRVFAFDYRGYGHSDGKPGSRHALQDAEAAYRYVVETRGIPPGRLIIHGRSVGAAFAVELAARHPVGGLIVQSGFVSAFRVITHVPLFPVDKLRSVRTLRTVKCPVLVVHGLQDDVIPAWHGKALFEAAPSPKYSLWVERAGHDDLPDMAGDTYWAALATFASAVRGGLQPGANK